MELFARSRKRWLSQFIDINEGIPTHQTLGRVFSLLGPLELEGCLREWIKQITLLFADDVIDGKTSRGSSHLRGNKKATHMVNAYSTRLSTTIGSTVTPDKTNEIKGIPILLKALAIKDKIITIDAMGTQKGKKHKKMQEAIRQHWQIENGWHYKLDVGMNEDQCPIYRGYADINLSIMRKIVLKLLTEDKSSQEGIILKRLKASLSTQYLKK